MLRNVSNTVGPSISFLVSINCSFVPVEQVQNCIYIDYKSCTKNALLFWVVVQIR